MYAIDDLIAAVRNGRSLAYWAAKKIQLESRRTHLGMLWVVLSFGISATGIAVVISELTGRSLVDHVPYVLFGFSAWNFISNCVVSGGAVFFSNRAMILQLPMPRFSFVFTLLFKNLYILIIQVVAASAIALLFGWRPSMIVWQVIPAFMLYFLTGIGAITVLGMVSTWMRDLSEVVGSVMRLAFFFTPVIWVYEERSNRLLSGAAEGEVSSSFMAWLTAFNPFSHFLAILREPMLGQAAPIEHWWVAAGICGILGFCALGLVQLGGRRVAYWL